MDKAFLSAVGADLERGASFLLMLHVGYPIYFNTNIKRLEERVNAMISRREYIKELVKRGRARVEVVNPEVDEWLQKADTIIKNWDTLHKEVDDNKAHLMGFFSNWCSRWNLSKQAKEQTDIVIGCLSQKFEMVTMPALSPNIEVFSEVPKIEGLESRKSTMNEVMRALGDDKNRRIGIYGMAGVGKTAIVMNVNNQLKEKSLFNYVIMVRLSKGVNLRSLQSKIAERLDLELEEKSDIISRARKLKQRFMQDYSLRFLIILDGLWEMMDLDEIGIPFGDNHSGCILLLTAQNERVCINMKCDIRIKVDLLSEAESLQLFKEFAGDVANVSALKPVTSAIANECVGLPLAIKILGEGLKENNVHTWNDVLSELKRSALPSAIAEMKEVLHESVRQSYDHLPEELKSCFLFCCLFPKAYDIGKDCLIKYWIVEGFIQNVNNWEAALNKGHSFVERLKCYSLLLDGSKSSGYTRMHDIFRNIAINIANDEHKFLVSVGLELDDWMKVDVGKECKKLSVMKNKFTKLLGKNHPQLLTLMLQENLNLWKIQDGFFMKTDSLRVLDLSNTVIRWLPTSISKLEKLQKLSLRECRHLKPSSLHLLGNLTSLEFLDLSRTNLTELPTAIEKLTKLRCLDLSLTERLEIIEGTVISKLVRLEELKMLGSSYKWETGGQGDKNNTTLASVASLTQLTCLFLSVDNLDQFSQDVSVISWAHLKRFCFFWNYGLGNPIDIEMLEGMAVYSRTMSISGSEIIPKWVMELFKQTTYLELQKCAGVESLLKLADDTSNAFICLEHLKIKDCDGIKYLVHGKENTLQQLEHLDLCNLDNLEKIISDGDPSDTGNSLQNLKSFKLCKCPKLTHQFLFQPSLMQRMLNLIELEVASMELEHMFLGGELYTLVLPKLKILTIANLYRMKSIWMGLIPQESLGNLQILKVSGCHSLKSILSMSIIVKGWIPHLNELLVEDCDKVVMIISKEEAQELICEEETVAFSKLRMVSFINLPRLNCFFDGEDALNLSSLEKIHVERCLNMKFPLAVHHVPSLERINGSKAWWERQEDNFKARFTDKFIAC